MMHLLKQLNGPNALLEFVNTNITRDLPFLEPYKEKLTVGCVCVCACYMAFAYVHVVSVCDYLLAKHLPSTHLL